jgi:uncharacterized protein (TIGR00369 family)
LTSRSLPEGAPEPRRGATAGDTPDVGTADVRAAGSSTHRTRADGSTADGSTADGSRADGSSRTDGGTADQLEALAADGPHDDAVPTVTIDGAPFPIRPHHCFACGQLNVDGLHMPLHIEGDSCWTELVLSDRFEGWEGIAHGGIVCTLLDEVMAWSLAARDAWSLTARMSIEFKRPIEIGRRIRGEGRLVEQRRRLITTEARLVDAETGELLATAKALYVMAPTAQRAALKRRYGFGDGAPA